MKAFTEFVFSLTGMVAGLFFWFEVLPWAVHRFRPGFRRNQIMPPRRKRPPTGNPKGRPPKKKETPYSAPTPPLPGIGGAQGGDQ